MNLIITQCQNRLRKRVGSSGNAECGMRNAEFVSLSLQFRVPHSAFRVNRNPPRSREVVLTCLLLCS